MKQIIGIYKITSPSGKIYIGQSINIIKRKNDYNYLRCKQQIKLYNSLFKYGFESHKFEIIEECSLEQLDEREFYHKQLELSKLNNNWKQVLFCQLKDGKGGEKSEETKQKISKANKGRKYSEQVKANMGMKKGFKYNKCSKKLMSQIQKTKNKQRLEKLKGRIGKWNLGKKRHLEHIEKLNIKTRKAVYQICPKTGYTINEFKSMKEAGRILGINPNGITEVIKGRQKTSYGYIWKIKNNK